MAGDAALVRAVPVRLRRVVAGRAAQRLLVLAGLLIAAWLLGCAAQSAHADEAPEPGGVVAETPVLEKTVTTLHQREPVRRVLRAAVRKAPRAEAGETPQQVAPPRDDRPGTVRKAPTASAAPRVHRADVPRVSKVSSARSSAVSRTRPATAGHATRPDVRHPMAPVPERHGDHHSDAGGLAGGVTAAYPGTGSWAPAPPRASVARILGAVPPAVRTAADEPSFAPD